MDYLAWIQCNLPALLVLVLGFVNMCCCGPVCTRCDGAPEQFQIDITGVVDAACTNCEFCNNTFIVDYTGEAFFCNWEYIDSGADLLCGGTNTNPTKVTVQQFFNAGVYETEVAVAAWNSFLTNYGDKIQWKYNHGATKPDCTAISGLNIPFLVNFGCEGGSSTCTLTAL